MGSLSRWVRYMCNKLEYAVSMSLKSYKGGRISDREFGYILCNHFVHGRLTYLYWNKGEEMAPTIAGQGGTLLVRRLPTVNPSSVYVGDIVVMKDPENADDYMVRRLAAVEGYEMVSSDANDEPFVLDPGQCWVLADNADLKPAEANDSRSFGPTSLSAIVGRVIYCLRTAVDHGPVHNSHFSMQKDSPVLQAELDVDEMAKTHKAE